MGAAIFLTVNTTTEQTTASGAQPGQGNALPYLPFPDDMPGFAHDIWDSIQTAASFEAVDRLSTFLFRKWPQDAVTERLLAACEARMELFL